MKVGNKIIEEDMETILKRLRQYLQENGIERFRNMQNNGDYIMTNCPMHKNGQELHPSCGILRVDKEGVSMGTCHCLRAGTRVPTKRGIRYIENLVNVNDVEILNGNGVWEHTRFRCYGSCKLIDIELRREQRVKHIFATPEHEWFCKKSNGRVAIKSTIDLVKNDYLESVIPEEQDFKLNVDAVQWGIIFADGTRINAYKTYKTKGIRRTDKSIIVGHYYDLNLSYKTEKVQLVRFFENDVNWHISDRTIEGKKYIGVRSKRIKTGVDFKKTLPDISMGRDFIMSFLAGYFACDGTVKGSSFSCVDLDVMNRLRDLFIFCGIAIRDCSALVRSPGATYLKDRCSILYTTKIIFDNIPQRFFLLSMKPQIKKYLRRRWRVERVTETSLVEPVYCCETSTQSFVIDENILTHNCFSCGYVRKFDEMISDLFGIDDRGAFGRQWLLDNFVNYEDETRDMKLDFDRTPTIEKVNYVTNEELDKYRYSHPYWAKRKIDEKTCIRFDLGYDKASKSITMPVWDLYGGCIGVTKRRVDRKAFHIPEGVTKPVYLLNYALKEKWREIYLCESQINALYLNSLGYNSCACFGTGTEQQAQDIIKCGVRSVIFCFDGDDAGRKGRLRMYNKLKERVFCTYVDLPEGKDVNDLSSVEIRELFRNIKNF